MTNTNLSKTIKISEQTHKGLVDVGNKGETFDQIIWRLIDAYENRD